MQQGSADPFYKSRDWLSLRFRALARDQYQCVFCGEPLKGKGKSRVDHILPRKSHPHLSLVLANVRSLCPGCDNKRHRDKGFNNDHLEPVAMNGAPVGWFDDCEKKQERKNDRSPAKKLHYTPAKKTPLHPRFHSLFLSFSTV